MQSELDGLFEGESDAPPDLAKSDGMAAWARAEPEFVRYLDSGEKSVGSLVNEIRDACHGSDTRIVIQGENWEQFLSPDAVASVVSNIDGVLVSAYGLTAGEAGQLMERSRAIAGEKELIVGIQAHFPEIPSSEEWRGKVRLCIEKGTTGLNFYNYGICTMSQLRGVGAVLSG